MGSGDAHQGMSAWVKVDVRLGLEFGYAVYGYMNGYGIGLRLRVRVKVKGKG